MMSFLNAHGFEPGPTQRPLLAGALTGLVAAAPASGAFAAFCSLRVLAHDILSLPQTLTAGMVILAFAVAGAVYGGLFRRGADDRHGGWLFGLAYSLLLWMVAPVIVLPLIPGMHMAAGRVAVGFLASFLTWGLFLGVLFPHVHKPLQADLDGSSALLDRIGGSAAARGGKRSTGRSGRGGARPAGESGLRPD